MRDEETAKHPDPRAVAVGGSRPKEEGLTTPWTFSYASVDGVTTIAATFSI